jgi:hypothetical protein
MEINPPLWGGKLKKATLAHFSACVVVENVMTG